MTADGRTAGEMSPYSRELLDAVEASISDWIRTAGENALRSSPAASSAGTDHEVVVNRVAGEVMRRLRDLLSDDVEVQRMNPLQVIRSAMVGLTEHLASIGCTPVHRDEFDVAAMPDDLFGIGPLTWRDLGDRVHETGITWGAWKAATIISRHRDDRDGSR